MPTNAPQMSAEEYQILFEFLKKEVRNPNKKEWFAHQTYTIRHNGKPVRFDLDFDIIRRRRTSDKLGVPCDIRAQVPFAEGFFGFVSTASSLVIYDDRLVFKEKGRLLKTVTFTKTYGPNELANESFMMSHVDDLHAKPATISSDKKRAYMAMRQLPGVELYTLFLKEHEKARWISQQHRFSLCLEIVKTIKTKLADKNIVHGDISNANILVLFKDGQFSIKLIDFGKSFLIKKAQTRTFSFSRQGTPDYALTTPKKDIIGLGKLFKIIWPEVFRGTLPISVRHNLTNTINKMIDEELHAEKPRITLVEVITIFESMQTSISSDFRQAVDLNYLQPEELEEITALTATNKPESVKQQRSPFSLGVSLFASITDADAQTNSLSPMKRTQVNISPSLMPVARECSSKNKTQKVPTLQLPFFPTIKPVKAVPLNLSIIDNLFAEKLRMQESSKAENKTFSPSRAGS